MSQLIEIEEKLNLRREEAADLLRKVADSLSRHNELEFERGGIRMRVDVPDDVEVEVELEITTDGGSLEIEIEW
jgi:amphi-Trp domain-containing protein